MAYCTSADVYEICGITSSDVNPTTMTKIILTAATRLNADINTRIVEEEALYIDSYRENKKDGTNATFYVQDSYRYFIGDYDDDGDVDTSDVIVYLYDPSARTKTQATVSSVDAKLGKIVLSAAPASSNKVYITYSRAPLDEATPARMIKEACKALAASLAYMKVRGDDYEKLQLGDFSISSYSGAQSRNRPFMVFQDYYNELVEKINSGELITADEIPNLKYLIVTEDAVTR